MSDERPSSPEMPSSPEAKSSGGTPTGRTEDPQMSGTKPSGLRNPVAAVRGVGAAALVVEAIVLLLAIQPMRVLGVRLTGFAIGSIVGLAVFCVLLAGALRRPWAWWAALVPQVALIACGYFHVSLAILGVLFLGLWLYVLSVRRSVLGR